VLYDILVANLAVAALVVGPARNIRPGFVLMPLRLRGRVTVSLLANTISLTPGTLSAFLSADGRTLVIHGLQVDDPDAIIATIRTRYEQPLLDSLEAPLKDAQERAGDPDASTAPASSGNGHTPARESE